MEEYKDGYKIQKLHDSEKQLLMSYKKYCDDNKLDYYLFYGTLLGAVRHQGFIPWDDDVDVAMKRDDYERFLEMVDKTPPQDFHVRTYKNTDYMEGNLAFHAKVESNYQYVMHQVGNKLVKQRVWLDIFVVDGMPKSKFWRSVHFGNVLFHYTMGRLARASFTGIDPRRKRIGLERVGKFALEKMHIGKFLDVNKQFSSFEKVLRKYPVTSSKWVIVFEEAYRKKCIYPQKVFKKEGKLFFEEEEFKVPIGYKWLLEHWYGDYMKLPPEEKRMPKHIEDVIIEK